MGVNERRKSRTSSRIYSRNIVVNGLRFFWVVIIIWGELSTFFWNLSSCRWPDKGFPVSAEKPTHILLISDPQVRHPAIIWGERSWLGSLRQFIFDSNLKKSWRVASRLKPHMIIFLGDMFATGQFAQDEIEYEQYSRKFKAMFPVSPSIPVYYIPGNNDIGMGIPHTLSKHVRFHYVETFGPFNQQILVRNHTLVLLDAPGLVDEDYQRAARSVGFDRWTPVHEGPVEFVKTIAADVHPVILFSHIPLARPDTASCGPLRERGTIRRGVGHGYQNTLGKQTTAFLLQTLRPSAIFSGDNRDYCEYTHTNPRPDRESMTKSTSIREVTVKSFSMANYIRRPGFQLLSLVDPSNTPSSTHNSYADRPCFLPDQLGVYSSLYFPLGLLSLLVLLFSNIYRTRQLRVPTIAPISLSPLGSDSNSGRSNPHLHPESAVWSPYTPPVPISPRGSLPPSLRTPNALAGPTLRAASRPATPQGSPLLSPMIYPHGDDDDESMYPTQYATRREGYVDGEWSAGQDADALDRDSARSSYFLPAPGLKPIGRRGWSWSWTFVLWGRRRRMTLRAPTLSSNSLWELSSLVTGGSDGDTLRRRGILGSTLFDGLSISCLATLTWVLIAWCM